ncbi:hypothetical protein P879_08847 [Paragonimus westermani]|uniref:PIH1D1/2/3 CS-like domain-containing protein n=1 Tax=Paragonimus westermani TaxID=34504 RepID=A0A8T0DFP3_9TREM|nr:hypothetical protein P879_08847 [Paragonimus westermani]
MAFNPNVFVQHDFPMDPLEASDEILPSAVDRKAEDNRYQLIWLGLHFLEMEKKLTTVESNSVICSSAPLRPKVLRPDARYGTSEQMLKSLGYYSRLKKAVQKSEEQHGSSSVNSLEIGGIVKQLGREENLTDNLTGQPDLGNQDKTFSEGEPLKLPQDLSIKKPQKKLIEEISTEKLKTINWRAEVIAAIQTGKSEMNRPNQLKLTFDLPGVTSGTQCDLDMTDKKLLLSILDSPEKYRPLEFELPCDINPETAVAKFNVKRKKLTVYAPILNSDS